MESDITLDLFINANRIARTENIDHIGQYILKNPLKLPKLLLSTVVQQYEFLEKSSNKLGDIEGLHRFIGPPGVSLEQSSSAITANIKSSLVGNCKNILDLTGGFGIDTLFFSYKAKDVTYIEQNALLAEIVQYNFKQIHVENVAFQVMTAENYLEQQTTFYDWIYLDPARRSDANQKLVKISDLSPNFVELAPVIWRFTNQIMLKLSPMIDLVQVQREIPYIKEIVVVSVKNDVKEVLLLLQKEWDNPPLITALNYLNSQKTQIFHFKLAQESSTFCPIGAPRKYIYEPNSAILKTGAFQQIGVQYHLTKLAKNTHLYTSDILIDDFPGRIFEVQHIYKPKKEVLQKELGKPIFANIISRNFGDNGEKIAQNFQIKPKNDTTYLLFTQLQDDKKVAILGKKVV